MQLNNDFLQIELYGMVTRQSPKGAQMKLKQMDAALKVDNVIRHLHAMTIDNNTNSANNNMNNSSSQQEQKQPTAQDIAETHQGSIGTM